MQGQPRPWWHSLIKKRKSKFSSFIRIQNGAVTKSYMTTASSYIGKNLLISSYIRKPFLIYDFATAPLWISLYMRKILFSFLSVWLVESYINEMVKSLQIYKCAQKKEKIFLYLLLGFLFGNSWSFLPVTQGTLVTHFFTKTNPFLQW